MVTERMVEEFGTEDLLGLLQELFGLPADTLAPTTTFDEIGLDSLALMELGAVLEERTGVELGSRLDQIPRSEPMDQVAQTIAGLLPR
ncbi:acyl carrier protein [Streptomyces sp. NPDC051582]|uniref:acyl carrier protein n=1 Tax=Streptomyces sp. NPDC051582 TaxID=3155167 RepID=UPI00341D9BE1